MKTGIVGPAEVVGKIMQIIQREFPQIEPREYLYKSYTEVPRLIQDQQAYLDAVLFAGSTPLVYAERYVKQTIPWEHIPRSSHSLLQVLLQIALAKKYDICRVSMDLYDQNEMAEILGEAGIDKQQFQIYAFEKSSLMDNYIDSVCAFHEQKFRSNQTDYCITALLNVEERLHAQRIPCFRVNPSTNVIRQTLHKLQLNHLVQISQQSQIVAVYIRIDPHGDYSLLNENEYQYIIDKTNVARYIYLFAQRVQAAVAEVGTREFLLFSTRKALESVTENYEKIDLLQTVKKNTSSTISIGVGYGETAQEAKSSAGLGMDKAGKLGGDTAFIVYSPNKVLGPIRMEERQKPQSSEHKIDQKFLLISEKAGISVNTVFRLYSILEQNARTRFTAAELAELAEVTPRTMNRILEKLAAHGYCLEVGKRVLNTAGRPSRIIEINIP